MFATNDLQFAPVLEAPSGYIYNMHALSLTGGLSVYNSSPPGGRWKIGWSEWQLTAHHVLVYQALQFRQQGAREGEGVDEPSAIFCFLLGNARIHSGQLVYSAA